MRAGRQRPSGVREVNNLLGFQGVVDTITGNRRRNILRVVPISDKKKNMMVKFFFLPPIEIIRVNKLVNISSQTIRGGKTTTGKEE